MLAIQATHSEAAQLLLDHGANPDVQYVSLHWMLKDYLMRFKEALWRSWRLVDS